MDTEKREEQGLSLSDLLFLVKRNIIMVIIVTMVFIIVGAVYGFKIKKPTYTATTTAIVYVDTSAGGNNPTMANNFSYATYFTSTFSSFIKSNPVLSVTSETLKEKYSYNNITRDYLKSCVSVSTETNSLILTINAKVSSRDDTKGREMARHIANTVIDSAIQEANKYKYDDNGNIILDKDGNPEYQYKVLADKLVVMEKVESNHDVTYRRGALTTILISFLIGLVLSFIIILIKYLTDDTFTSKESFEEVTGINVLSIIGKVTASGGNK